MLQTFSPMHQKIKKRKTIRPDPAVTDLHFSLLRTSLNFRHSFDSHTPSSCREEYASRRNRSEFQAVTTDVTTVKLVAYRLMNRADRRAECHTVDRSTVNSYPDLPNLQTD